MSFIKNKPYKKINGFTLIELIVVITILAILGTISFVSFNSYSSSARDSARISDLGNISKSLSIYQTTQGTLPMPSGTYTTITASGTAIGYQGYAGITVTSIIGINGKVIDPLDKLEYTYLVNTDKNKFQLLGYGEESKNFSYINDIKTLALDYKNRYLIFKGDKLGVILEKTTNTPIQENTSIHTSTNTFDVVTFTGGSGNKEVTINYDKIEKLSGTGSDFQALRGGLTLASGLVGYWPFSEGAGTIAYDKSGNGNNGTLSGGVGWVNGKIGKGVQFDGIDDSIITSYTQELSKDGSISVWATFNSLLKDDLLFGSRKNSVPTGFLWAGITGSGYYNFGWGNQSLDWNVKNKHTLNIGEWNNFIVTRLGNKLTFYKNGNIIGYLTVSTDQGISLPLYIGDINGTSGFKHNGYIDEVRIYDRSLSDSEIQSLYNAIK